jgi:hypothetical protein
VNSVNHVDEEQIIRINPNQTLQLLPLNWPEMAPEPGQIYSFAQKLVKNLMNNQIIEIINMKNADCSTRILNSTDTLRPASGADWKFRLLSRGAGFLLRLERHKVVPVQIRKRQRPCDSDLVPEHPPRYAERG